MAGFDKRALWREIGKEGRKKNREKIKSLREEIKRARSAKRAAITKAKARCKALRAKAKHEADKIRARAKGAARAKWLSARETCAVTKVSARAKVGVEERLSALKEEREYQASLRRLERANRQRQAGAKRASASERRQESDDEVRQNIDPTLWRLFEKTKRQFRATPYMTRTEAFLKYVEEHPREMNEVIEEETDRLIAEMERRQRSEYSTSAERDPSLTARQRRFIPKKIAVLVREGYPQRQAVAIAYQMAGASRKRAG